MKEHRSKLNTAIVLALLASVSCAKTRAPAIDAVDAAAPVRAAGSASVTPASSVLPAVSASGQAPSPAASANPAEQPDVRIEIPFSTKGGVSLKAEVKVGQKFGLLLPNPDPQDWLDMWEVEACPTDEGRPPRCPLGEPLTVAPRDPDPAQPQSTPPRPRREVVWKVGPDRIGTHPLKVRYIHRTMRTDRGTPTRRVLVDVSVVP